MKNIENLTELVNCKKVTYKGKTEYRLYNRPILVGTEKTIDKPTYIDFDGFKVNSETGEVRSNKSIEHSLKSSLSRTVNTIYEIAFSNEWDWFLTFTFNPDNVNRYDYDECYKKLSKFLNNFKNRYCIDMKYLIVPEIHKDAAFHFHGLFSNVDDFYFTDSGHKSFGQIVYNFDSYKLGFSTATKVQDTKKVSSYITKYITKDLIKSSNGKHRYLCSKNVNRALIENSYISPEEFVNLKIELLQQASYTKEISIEKAHQQITYIHID